MKKSIVVTAALAVFGVTAQADGLSANVGLASKYKFRGQDQSDSSRGLVPALQGGFDYALSGFYVGNWNSAVGFADGTEMDFYGGYKGELAGVGYDVGVLQYYYPGAGNKPLNTTEIYGGLSYAFVSAKLSYVASDKYFGATDSRGTLYIDLSANYEIVKSLTLNGHLGFTQFNGGSNYGPDYVDYKVGATYDLGSGFSLGAALVGATKRDSYQALFGADVNKPRPIVTLAKAM